jgi:hypothetical protein
MYEYNCQIFSHNREKVEKKSEMLLSRSNLILPKNSMFKKFIIGFQR